MESTKIRVFADSSVLYSAIASREGASREVLRRHIRDELTIVVSEYVLQEVERNLANKAPIKGKLLMQVITIAQFEIASPSKEHVLEVAQYTELKDAPIIAGAQTSNCPILLTYDYKHLITPTQVAEKSGLQIMTSGSLLQNIL